MLHYTFVLQRSGRLDMGTTMGGDRHTFFRTRRKTRGISSIAPCISCQMKIQELAKNAIYLVSTLPAPTRQKCTIQLAI